MTVSACFAARCGRSASYPGKSGGRAAPANHRRGMPTAQRYLFHDRLIHPATERKRLQSGASRNTRS